MSEARPGAGPQPAGRPESLADLLLAFPKLDPPDDEAPDVWEETWEEIEAERKSDYGRPELDFGEVE